MFAGPQRFQTFVQHLFRCSNTESSLQVGVSIYIFKRRWCCFSFLMLRNKWRPETPCPRERKSSAPKVETRKERSTFKTSRNPTQTTPVPRSFLQRHHNLLPTPVSRRSHGHHGHCPAHFFQHDTIRSHTSLSNAARPGQWKIYNLLVVGYNDRRRRMVGVPSLFAVSKITQFLARWSSIHVELPT